MQIQFSKMHGLGNDFVVIDNVTQNVFFSKEKIQQLSDRNFGIGFDQLLLVEPPYDPDQDFHYRIFNADGSMDPNEINKFYDNMNKNDIDLIFGSRYTKNGSSEDDTIVTYVGNKIFTLIGKIFFSLKITDILYTYVMGKTDKILSLKLKRKDFRLCVELPIKAKRNNLKIGDISAKEKSRIGGTKKVNTIKDGFLILTEMIYLFFNNKK